MNRSTDVTSIDTHLHELLAVLALLLLDAVVQCAELLILQLATVVQLFTQLRKVGC